MPVIVVFILAAVVSITSAASELPKIALIIDDLGYNLTRDKQLIEMKLPITVSIIPDYNHSKKLAQLSDENGIEVMLHLPMESTTGLSIGNIGLSSEMNEAEKTTMLELALSEVPMAVGVNNHMGSQLTTDQSAMSWLMHELQQRGLFFVDSLTVPTSLAGDTAMNSGLNWGVRNVFLDNIRSQKYMEQQFQQALRYARRHGKVIMIGHSYPETLSFIKSRIPLALDFEQVEFVPVSSILSAPIVTTASQPTAN